MPGCLLPAELANGGPPGEKRRRGRQASPGALTGSPGPFGQANHAQVHTWEEQRAPRCHTDSRCSGLHTPGPCLARCRLPLLREEGHRPQRACVSSRRSEGGITFSISGSARRSAFAEPRPMRKTLRGARVARGTRGSKGDKFRPSPDEHREARRAGGGPPTRPGDQGLSPHAHPSLAHRRLYASPRRSVRTAPGPGQDSSMSAECWRAGPGRHAALSPRTRGLRPVLRGVLPAAPRAASRA